MARRLVHTQYEYDIISTINTSGGGKWASDLETQLKSRGKQGWRVVGIVSADPTHPRIILERPVKPTEPE